MENLTLIGTSALAATGNSLANVLVGNGAANVLSGAAGNDILDGAAGADRMLGGAGNDIYRVDNTHDIVDESAAGSGGIDTVQSSISFNLANTASVKGLVENLTLVGASSIAATGNGLANVLRGNGAANVMNGASGNDTLDGGGGKDVLTGGAGHDTFVFSSALNAVNNVDIVKDFNVADDTVALDNAVMRGLGSAVGTLSAVQFWTNTTGLAHDSSDRIIYETDTGKLFYDADGSGAVAGVHFATLAPNLSLTNLDFVVM
ncbi:hypothetical protein AB4144_23140 [Rhizobiaceae sp. 2RAB30]